jgi:hypothetical protein
MIFLAPSCHSNNQPVSTKVPFPPAPGPTPSKRRQSVVVEDPIQSTDPLLMPYQHGNYIHVLWVKQLTGHIALAMTRKGKKKVVLKLTDKQEDYEHEKTILEKLKVFRGKGIRLMCCVLFNMHTMHRQGTSASKMVVELTSFWEPSESNGDVRFCLELEELDSDLSDYIDDPDGPHQVPMSLLCKRY